MIVYLEPYTLVLLMMKRNTSHAAHIVKYSVLTSYTVYLVPYSLENSTASLVSFQLSLKFLNVLLKATKGLSVEG